jgi:glycosyltransferase involved in cell wall biosynthesis
MKMLALTKYGREAASTRQRLIQFAPLLAANGIDISYAPLFDDAYVASLARGARTPILQVAGAYMSRLAVLGKARRFDVIWVHYEVLPWLPAIFERLVGLANRPVIVDFDDAIFHMYDAHRFSLVRHLLGRKLEPLMRTATAITAGNAYLAEYARRFNDQVAVIPTVVDTDTYLPAVRTEGVPPVVGWIGSPSTWRYAEEALPALLPVIAAHDARFVAVGAGPKANRWSQVESVEWAEESEIAAVQAMDIGIMPLPDEKWARGKCGYKLIQYMGCGLPTIASPVGVNADIVADGVTGFLAIEPAAWADRLDTLLTNPALRARMGAAGRARVVERYSLASQGPRLLEIVRAATAPSAAA